MKKDGLLEYFYMDEFENLESKTKSPLRWYVPWPGSQQILQYLFLNPNGSQEWREIPIVVNWKRETEKDK